MTSCLGVIKRHAINRYTTSGLQIFGECYDVYNNVAYIMTKLCNSYTMGCPPVRGDNPRALASGLSHVQVDERGITILYHLHQCRPCSLINISC